MLMDVLQGCRGLSEMLIESLRGSPPSPPSAPLPLFVPTQEKSATDNHSLNYAKLRILHDTQGILT